MATYKVVYADDEHGVTSKIIHHKTVDKADTRRFGAKLWTLSGVVEVEILDETNEQLQEYQRNNPPRTR